MRLIYLFVLFVCIKANSQTMFGDSGGGSYPDNNYKRIVTFLDTSTYYNRSKKAFFYYDARVEAEDYSNMKGVQKEICSEGGQNVAFIDKDDWLEYDITPGVYKINFRLASIYSGGQFQIRQSNGSVIYTVQVPNTGGWQTWKTVQTVQVTLPSKIRLYSNTSGWNINWFELLPTNTSPVITIVAPDTVYFPEELTVSAIVKDAEGDIVKTQWSFDGVSQGEVMLKDSLISPAWFLPGQVNVRLIGIDTKGASNTVSKKIVVLYDRNRELGPYPLGVMGWLYIKANGSIRFINK